MAAVMQDDALREPKENPIATAALDRAWTPYTPFLPADAIKELRQLTHDMLIYHPFGAALIARLSPSILVEANVSADKTERGFQGYAVTNILRALMVKVREVKCGGADPLFLPPDQCFLCLQAFVGYAVAPETVWTTPYQDVQMFLHQFSDGMVAALIVGLMRELRSLPAPEKEWGDVGRVLREDKPGFASLFARAVAALPRSDQTFLDAYAGCRWDMAMLERRLRLRGREVVQRSSRLFQHLGGSLREQLGAEP